MDKSRESQDSGLSVAPQLGLGSIFIAGPFLKAIDPATGRLPPHVQQRLEATIDHFEAHGCRVFNAHKREKWGEEFLEPLVYTRLDFDEIMQSDAVIAMPGPPASLGTHVELGWASAARKPIVLLLQSGVEYAGLVTGLASITVIETVEMVDGIAPLASIDAALARAMQRTRSSAADAGTSVQPAVA